MSAPSQSMDIPSSNSPPPTGPSSDISALRERIANMNASSPKSSLRAPIPPVPTITESAIEAPPASLPPEKYIYI